MESIMQGEATSRQGQRVDSFSISVLFSGFLLGACTRACATWNSTHRMLCACLPEMLAVWQVLNGGMAKKKKKKVRVIFGDV